MNRIIQMKFHHKKFTHLQCLSIGVPSIEIALLTQITDSSKSSLLKYIKLPFEQNELDLHCIIKNSTQESPIVYTHLILF